MRAVYYLTTALAATSMVHASTIYFSGTSNEVSGKTNTLYKYDTIGKTVNEVVLSDDPVQDTAALVSGAALCGSYYYGIWADVSSDSYGVVEVNLTTGDAKTYQTAELFHGIWCTPGKSRSLIAVGSLSGNNGAQFSVRIWDVPTQTEQLITSFDERGLIYPGVDTIFSYDKATNSVYAAFPKSSQLFKTGKIFVVDVASNVTSTYDMPNFGAGWPYMVIPGPSPTYGAVHSKSELPDNVLDLEWAEFTLSGSTASVKKTGVDVFKTLYTGRDIALCNGTLYSFVGQTNNLSAVDSTTGQNLWMNNVKVPAKYTLGAIGC